MVSKWEIYYVNLNPTQGSEQNGRRPVLVISNDAVNHNLPIFTCIPFSSIKPSAKIYPTEIKLTAAESGLSKDSVLMVQQIRTIANARIASGVVNKITDTKIQDKINEVIKEYFDLYKTLSQFCLRFSIIYLCHLEPNNTRADCVKQSALLLCSRKIS